MNDVWASSLFSGSPRENIAMSFIAMALALVVGMTVKKLDLLNATAPALINKAIINLALPAVILLKVPALQFDVNALVPIAVAWFVLLVTAMIIYLLSKYFAWEKDVTGALLLIVPLCNSAYLGIPLINAITNEETVRYAIMYDQFGVFFGLALYAPIVVSLLSTGGSFKPWPILKDIILFTPFPVALISLFVLDAQSIPPALTLVLGWLAFCMGPAAAFVIGISLRFSLAKTLRVPLYSAVIVKLIVAPLIVFALANVVSLYEPVKHASVLQSAMPSMITAGLVAIAAGFNERLVIAVTGATTMLSIVTLSIWWLMLNA